MADNQENWMENDEDEVQIIEYDVTASSNDFNVSTIVNFLEQGAIQLPAYQRNYTWEKKRASKLIESLVIGLPVPQIFLYEESRNKFSILDGQQRMLSIFFYSKKRFPKKNKRAELRDIFVQHSGYPEHILADDKYFENFNLELPSEAERVNPLHDLNYDTLGDYTTQLKLRPVRCIIVKQNEPKDDNSSVYEMFDRLNTGGINLKPQEIRANLYFGEFYKMIYELNKLPSWRKFLAQPDPDTNLRDVELILRATAMLVYAENYKPSMTRFLNRFSGYSKSKLTDHDIQVIKKIFQKFMEKVAVINHVQFKPTGRLSIAIFESAFVACCNEAWRLKDQPNCEELVKPITNELVKALIDELQGKLLEGTSKTENVKQRLAIATEIFK
jgi:Protein of unknown function DUF262